MNRQEAVLAGLKTFNTGRPCKNGHYSPRYTSTASCVDCLRGRPPNLVPLEPTVLRQQLQAAEAEVARLWELVIAEDLERAEALRTAARISYEITQDRQRTERMRKAAERNTHRVSVRCRDRHVPDVIALGASLQLCRDDYDPQDVRQSKPMAGTTLVTMRAHPDDHAAIKAEVARLLGATAAEGREARAARVEAETNRLRELGKIT